jgi:polygalacturonase
MIKRPFLVRNHAFLALAVSLLPWLAAVPAGAQSSAVHPELPLIPARTNDITRFGAVGDGTTNNTRAIQAAIAATRAAGGGTVEIPPGIFLSGPLTLAGQIRLQLDAGARLRLLPLGQYPGGTNDPANFLSGSGLQDLAISGAGAIDGQGEAWWPVASNKNARRPRLIALSSCNRVLIENVTLSNSPMFHIAISGKSRNITVRGVTIRANPSTDPVHPGHNTDACDVTGRNVLIENCDVSVGDDNFTCGGGTSDVLIRNCTYGYGHGVSIGSGIGKGGVSNLTVINCTFSNTEAGIRIKTDRDRGGVAQQLTYLNLTMTKVNFPILIYAAYANTNPIYRALAKLTPDQAAAYPTAALKERTPSYRDLVFSNITASVQPGYRAGLIWGLPEMAVSNVLLQQLNITADRPFALYDVRNVRVVDSQIHTPAGVSAWAVTNAEVTFDKASAN